MVEGSPLMNSEFAYAIFTDTGADMPWGTARQQQVEIAHLHYKMNDAAYTYDLGRETDLTAFYFAMRNGTAVGTIPVLPEAFCALWEPHLMEGRDVLMLSISRHLSRTFLAAQHAREELLARYPERRVVVVDTLCCAVAQGMLVFEASHMRREGKGMDAVAAWVVENRQYVNALLLPANLKWLRESGLYEGGAMGELMGRRTLLRMDAAGGLVTEAKSKNEEEALFAIAGSIQRMGYALNSQIVGITHADAPELAAQLRDILCTQAGCSDATILPMGPITGCYAGPGAVGVAFFGSRRL